MENILFGLKVLLAFAELIVTAFSLYCLGTAIHEFYLRMKRDHVDFFDFFLIALFSGIFGFSLSMLIKSIEIILP